MSVVRSVNDGWARLRAAARREFLRDPDVVIFERAGEPAILPRRDRVGSR